MDATARIAVAAGPGGRPCVRELVTPAPLGARFADGALHLLGTAAGPLGGDRLRVEVVVGTGARLTVRSVAAAVVQRGNGTPSTHHVEVAVAAGGHLDWCVEPLVAAAGCDHRATATVTLAGGASVRWRDELVLGRHGEAPGRCTSTLRIVRDGVPVIHHEVSTAVSGWDGPAVTAGARVVGQLAVVGRGEVPPTEVVDGDAAWLRLEPDVGLGVVLAADHPTLRRTLDAWARSDATGAPVRLGSTDQGARVVSGTTHTPSSRR